MEAEDLDSIIERVKRDDLTAFGLLYDAYNQQIYGKCLFILKDEVLAKDAVHDVFLRVLVKIHQLNDVKQFNGWINRLCYNICMDVFRKQSRENAENTIYVEEISTLFDELDSIQADELLRKYLKQFISELKEVDRLVITMHYWDNMGVNEIAEQLSLSSSAVKMKLKRTREALREQLKTVMDKDDMTLFMVVSIFFKIVCDQSSLVTSY